MEIKAAAGNSQQHAEHKLPPVKSESHPEIERKTRVHKAVYMTCQSTAKFSNHLPTGTVLAFQLLSPLVTKQGDCSSLGHCLTAVLIALCAVSCFTLSFTDSFRDEQRNVCYGFATFRGLWVIDGSAKLSPELAAKCKLQITDFIHGSLSALVFLTVAMFDQNVMGCFFPTYSLNTSEYLKAVPLGVGAICSALFLIFPNRRHGIGSTETDH